MSSPTTRGSPANFVRRLTPEQAQRALPTLIDLLVDAVDSGASIGFLPPVTRSEAADYWREVSEVIRTGSKILFAVYGDNDMIAGSVQVEFAGRANALHRAEIQKLMVRTDYRRQGLGRVLMESAERACLSQGRSLVVLDTRKGDPSEKLYESMGYQRAGEIPDYARSAGGELHTTVIFYKQL
jgi:ribosomal protein S18 acetylase RimI-like enzyme